MIVGMTTFTFVHVVLSLLGIASGFVVLAGPWRSTYAGGAVTLLYLNVFVLIVQLFLKVPTLRTIAPTQSDPPFVITQALALAVFAFLGTAAVKRFHPGTRIAA